MGFKYMIEVDDKGTPKVKKFSGSIKENAKSSQKAEKALKMFSAGIGGMAVAVVGGTGALFAMSKAFAESQDKIRKMGRELGLSTEFLSSMEFSAKLAGTSLETVDKSMGRLSRTALDAQNGLSTAKRAFADLGIETKNQDGTFKELDSILFDVSDKFKEMPDGVLKVAKAQELFGRGGKQMINLLNQGSVALKEQAEEAKSLGIVFDNETAEKAEEFNDTMLRLGETFRGFFMEVSNDLIPIFTTGMGDMQSNLQDLKPLLLDIADLGVSAMEFIIPLAKDLGEEVNDLVLGWGQLSKELDIIMGKSQNTFKLTPEAEARIARVEKAKAEAEKQVKIDERQAKRQEKIDQQREVTRRKNADAQRARNKADAQRKKDNDAKEEQREKDRIQAQADKELEVLRKGQAEYEAHLAKKAELADSTNAQITLDLMEETERRKAIINSEHEARILAGGSEIESEKLKQQQLTQIETEAQAKRQANRMQAMAQVAEGFSLASQALSNINQIEQNKITERFEKRKEKIEKTYQAEIDGAEGNAERQDELRKERDDKLRTQDKKREEQLKKASKKGAALRKGVAMGEAVSNGALAITRAYAEGGPFAGPVLAGLIGAVTATQVGLIASQKFFEGGMIKGKDTLISTNENGKESILNARATSAVGEDALNDFNSGRTLDALDKIQSSIGGSSKGISISISGGVVDRRFAEEQLIPMLSKVMRNK